MATTAFVIGQIYVLVDPRTRAVRYCGKTITSLKARLATHMCSVRDWPDRPISKWLATLVRIGLKPVIRSVERIHLSIAGDLDEGLNSAERKWIIHYREIGCRMTNVSNGGTGPGRKARANMSKAQRARDPSTYLRGEDHQHWGKHINLARDPEAKRRHQQAAWRDPEKRAAHGRLGLGNKRAAILNEAEVHAIRNDPRSERAIARDYSVSRSAINLIKRRLRQANVA